MSKEYRFQVTVKADVPASVTRDMVKEALEDYRGLDSEHGILEFSKVSVKWVQGGIQ